jgi:hypothetical protein
MLTATWHPKIVQDYSFDSAQLLKWQDKHQDHQVLTVKLLIVARGAKFILP